MNKILIEVPQLTKCGDYFYTEGVKAAAVNTIGTVSASATTVSANNTTSTSAGGEVTFPVPKKCGYLFTNNKSFSKLFSPGKHQLQADRENVLMSPSSVRKSPRVKLSTRSPCRLTSGSPQKISESNQADQHSTGSSDCLTKLSAVTPSPTTTTVTNNSTTLSTTPQKMRHSASNTAAVSNVTHHRSITPPAHTAKYGTVCCHTTTQSATES